MKPDDDQFLYDNLPASRRTDALVAVSIFGWRWMKYKAPNMSDGWARELTGIYPPKEICSIECPNEYWKIWKESSPFQELFSNWDQPVWWDLDGEYQRGLPHYSTDLEDSWSVVDALEQKKILFKIVRVSFYQDKFVWSSEFRECFDSFRHYYSEAETPSLAICRAALLAVTQPNNQFQPTGGILPVNGNLLTSEGDPAPEVMPGPPPVG